MTVYTYELKTQLKSFAVWAVCLLVFYYVCMAGLFPTFMAQKDAVEQVYAGFPPAFSAAFGIIISQIFTFAGLFQFVSIYIGVVGAMMASALSLAVFSREKRNKCVDFLFTKPVGRLSVFWEKLLACLTLLVLFNILFILTVFLSKSVSPDENLTAGRLVWASMYLFFTQLVFMGFGAIWAVLARKVRSVSGLATGFGFAGFILSALHSLLGEEALRFFAPLDYFDPYTVFSTGGFELKYALTGAAVFAVCLFAAAYSYCRADTRAL